MRSSIISIIFSLISLHEVHPLCITTLHTCVQLLPNADENIILGVLETIKEATVPSRVTDAISSGLAGAVSGAVGGLASRRVADILGNKKIDTTITKVSATSVFFGIRSLVRVSLRFLGLPQPITILLASLLASIISELTKYLGRSNQSKKITASMTSLLGEDLVLDWPEIGGDVSKWVFYDITKEVLDNPLEYSVDSTKWFYLLLQEYITDPSKSNIIADNLIHFSVGALAGVVDISVRDFLSRSGKTSIENDSSVIKPSKSIQYSQYALEGGILFLAYEIIVKITGAIVPASLNNELIFERLLESFEKDVVAER